jgi:hypothetical protein
LQARTDAPAIAASWGIDNSASKGVRLAEIPLEYDVGAVICAFPPDRGR